MQRPVLGHALSSMLTYKSRFIKGLEINKFRDTQVKTSSKGHSALQVNPKTQRSITFYEMFVYSVKHILR